jgi:hypothetical protein
LHGYYGTAQLPLQCTGFCGISAYKNFKVAVYARAYEVQKMDSIQWLERIWNEISQQVNGSTKSTLKPIVT